jgi:hypothetical protein
MGRSKGSQNGKTKDLTGLRFGLLTAISIDRVEEVQWTSRKAIDTWWLCKCDCGNDKIVSGWRLTKEERAFHCGCLTKEVRNTVEWRSRLFKKDSAFRRVLAQYKADAKRRGLSWDLTDDQFKTITSSPCYYTGMLPLREMEVASGEVYLYNGIDRVKSSIGYTQDNCVPCCTEINFMKRNSTKEKFIELCSKVAERFNSCLAPL